MLFSGIFSGSCNLVPRVLSHSLGRLGENPGNEVGVLDILRNILRDLKRSQHVKKHKTELKKFDTRLNYGEIG